jgi:hypothetical protein
MIGIGNLTQYGLEYVLGNLREHDQLEVAATVDQGSALDTAKLLWSVPGPKWEMRTHDNIPAIVGGFTPVWNGLGSGWMFGTDDWDAVALECTKAVKKHIIPALERNGVRRIEARPMAGNDKALRWLKLVGFKQDAVTAQFGRGGEDFLLFSRLTHETRLH